MNALADRLVGDSLRSLRSKAKLTQADVAHALGKPQSFVSKVESGERSLRIHEMYGYAEALGIPYEQLAACVRDELELSTDS